MSRFAARFSQPLETARVFAKDAGLIKSVNGWHAETLLSGEDASCVSDFYPYPPVNFVVAHSRITVRGKVIVPLEPSAPSAALDRVSYVWTDVESLLKGESVAMTTKPYGCSVKYAE